MTHLLTSYYWSGETIRSRNVSAIVLTRTIDLPAINARLAADWDRELSTRTILEPGDVEEMPFARARARWPEYTQCVNALAGWTHSLGLDELLVSSDVALMACRGASYHHDGEQYGSAAFCNLFLSEDNGLDLLFPLAGCRIPLTRGTAVIFDTCQPHGVIERGGHDFSSAAFLPGRDYTQMFLTWELPIEDKRIARALNIAFDTDIPGALRITDEQVRLKGEKVEVCPDTGRWRAAAG